MKASDYIQQWCNLHGGNGKNWKEVVSRIAPDDVFNFNVVSFAHRPFDMKHIVYTGRIGVISSPRWAIAKQFLLRQDSQWRYGTERLLWVYEDKPDDLLDYECRLTIANMEQCPLDEQWLCDFNMFRVAAGMMQVKERKIAEYDLFTNVKVRKIEDYDPYARPCGFVVQGSGWRKILERIGNIEKYNNQST